MQGFFVVVAPADWFLAKQNVLRHLLIGRHFVTVLMNKHKNHKPRFSASCCAGRPTTLHRLIKMNTNK